MRGVAVLPVSEAARANLMTDGEKTRNSHRKTHTTNRKHITQLPKTTTVPNNSDMADGTLNEGSEFHDLPPLLEIDDVDNIRMEGQLTPGMHVAEVDGPSFTELISLFNPKIVFPHCLKDLYVQDSFFQKINEQLLAYLKWKDGKSKFPGNVLKSLKRNWQKRKLTLLMILPVGESLTPSTRMQTNMLT